MLRVMVRYSNHEVLEGKKSALMSLGSERKAVCTMNEQLTISKLTDLPSICRQLAQHRHRIAYGLSIFVGSGLAADNHLEASAMVPEEIVIQES